MMVGSGSCGLWIRRQCEVLDCPQVTSQHRSSQPCALCCCMRDMRIDCCLECSSWGSGWGNNGFAYLPRDQNCFLLTSQAPVFFKDVSSTGPSSVGPTIGPTNLPTIAEANEELSFSATLRDANYFRFNSTLRSVTERAVALVASISPEDVQCSHIGSNDSLISGSSCYQLSSCEQCVARSDCGFCPADGACAPGSVHGTNASAGSLCSSGKGGYKWSTCDVLQPTPAPTAAGACIECLSDFF